MIPTKNSKENLSATSRNQLRTESAKQQKKRLRVIFFIIAAIFVIFSGFFFHHLSQIYQAAQTTAKKVYRSSQITKVRDSDQLLKAKRPISILLMGTDTGALGRNFKGRTDTLILAVLNPAKQKITLVSLPRDALVAVYGFENYYPSKLNSAYDFGGSGTAVNTVQQSLNIPIDFYATIHMGGLENLDQSVGGASTDPILTFKMGGTYFKNINTHVM